MIAFKAPSTIVCGRCDGYGHDHEGIACPRCEGAGELVLKLPAGFDSGDIDEAIEQRNNRATSAKEDL
jgi:DnaJ-class molecular chaperone